MVFKRNKSKLKKEVPLVNYKIPCRDFSISTQHLVLIVEHSIQLEKLKIDKDCSTWGNLLEKNNHLLEPKARLKELFNISQFPEYELNKLASRAVEVIKKHYPQLIIKSEEVGMSLIE